MVAEKCENSGYSVGEWDEQRGSGQLQRLGWRLADGKDYRRPMKVVWGIVWYDAGWGPGCWRSGERAGSAVAAVVVGYSEVHSGQEIVLQVAVEDALVVGCTWPCSEGFHLAFVPQPRGICLAALGSGGETLHIDKLNPKWRHQSALAVEQSPIR